MVQERTSLNYCSVSGDLAKELGQKVFGVLSAELCTMMTLGLVRKRWVTSSERFFFWEFPCMYIYVTFGVSHYALWGEYKKLVSVFLWACPSVSLAVNEHQGVS